ncbi:protein ABIL1-like isoform X2 [Ipomoea triloba]|uniref:protein ABIL1-like isoform X2 n=1 Tax=Ipomoea triloba TaxID=35885 RepID=UPI00125D9521|nr:protein ABIL1-like isoform X2 [Ipomoea triloba]
MEVQKTKPMTLHQLSFERNNSFVNALQELKNLRPQLYSAAEFCEKSYLYSEQKPMVFINLKDYAARALVNAVDHLGTVAYKLSELLEHQSLDISIMESKIACLNQQFLTFQMYAVKEGLRRHQLLAIIPRHQKHYTLSNSLSKKVHFSAQIQMDPGQHMQSSSLLCPSGTPATNSLSRNLALETKSALKEALYAFTSCEDIKGSERASGASETKSTLKEALRAFTSCEDIKGSGRASGASETKSTLKEALRASMRLVICEDTKGSERASGAPNMLVLLTDGEEINRAKASADPPQSTNVDSASSVRMQALGLLGRIMCACMIHDALA